MVNTGAEGAHPRSRGATLRQKDRGADGLIHCLHMLQACITFPFPFVRSLLEYHHVF